MLIERLLADPRALARRVAARVLAPPPPVDLAAWAVKNIAFGDESPLPGPYDPGKFPFFARIMEVLSPEHPATTVTIRKSAQLGGTVLAQIFVGAVLHQAPKPILYVHPTDGNAIKWKRGKFAAMVKASTVLESIMQPETARKGNAAMYWARRDGRGYLQLAGANSPSQLSMDSFPIAVHDDMAKWLADNGAGCPEVQADSRSKAFKLTGGKVLKISTPAVEPGCRISRSWRQGTRERYHVPCLHCGAFQPLEWANLLANLDEADPAGAHFTCTHCNGRIDEHHRDAMNRRGVWVAENPAADAPSFHLWAAYSPLESWENLARAWLNAKGNPEAERSFSNDWLGEAYQTATAAPPWEGLRDRAEAAGLPRGVVPAGHYFVTIGCDCQVDRVEWQAVAFGPRLRRAVIDHGIVHHHVGTEEAHRQLSALAARTWPDALGNRRPLDCMAIDGGAWGVDIHAWAKADRSGKVIVVKGAKSDSAPPLARVKHERRSDGQIVKASKKWFLVGVSGLKASLYANLAKTDQLDLGFVGFVAGFEDEFFRELTSEVRKPIRLRSGGTEWRWTPQPGVDQEMLDCHLYAVAAAIRAGWMNAGDEDFAKLAARWDKQPEAPDLFSVAAAAKPASETKVMEEAPPQPVKSRYISG